MTKAIAKTKTKAKPKVTPACTRCTGLCCRYFALPLDKPEDWKDFDDIRWYLCPEHTSVFVEEGEWYLNVNNKCRYLSEQDHRCQMYGVRPKICRGYDTDKCDLTGGDYGYELHFTTDTQMEEYMRIKFGDKVFDTLEKLLNERLRPLPIGRPKNSTPNDSFFVKNRTVPVLPNIGV